MSDNKKLEDLARKMSKKIDCDMYIRHKTLMIPLSVLRKHKIEFTRVGNVFHEKNFRKLLNLYLIATITFSHPF